MSPVSPAQLRQLPVTLDRVVAPADIDLNRHMNAAALFTAQVSSVRAELAGIGITERYVAERCMGTFAVEHHLRYFGELHEGERLTTRVRFLQRTAKALHVQSFLVNESREQLSCVLEVVCLHVDQETRRATAVPADVSLALDARLRAGAALDWSLPYELSFRTGATSVGRG